MNKLTGSIVLAALSLFLSIESSAQCPNAASTIMSEWEVVKAGETVKLEVRQPNGELDKGEFVWEVPNGTIVSGQQTNRIVVSTSATALETSEAKPKPESEPKQDDVHGYIWIIGFHSERNRTVPLNVVATSISQAGCSDVRFSTTIRIGRRSVAVDRPADATDLTLSETSEPMIVDVSTKAIDFEDDPLTYNYTITAGKIIGTGANVKWDLTGVLPGTYEIKVAVDDGCGECGKTVTRSFTVKKD